MCSINGGERCTKFEMSYVLESVVIKHLLMDFEHDWMYIYLFGYFSSSICVKNQCFRSSYEWDKCWEWIKVIWGSFGEAAASD